MSMTNAEELRKEIQQRETELAALKNKFHQLCPSSDLGNDIVKKEVLENDSRHLTSYKSEENPDNYEREYSTLQEFIDGSLDCHKYELSSVLYPIFVHMYLELIYNRHLAAGKKFFEKFRGAQQPYHGSDIVELSIISIPEHLINNRLIQTYRNNKSSIMMYKDSHNRLKKFVQDSKLQSIDKIIANHLSIDVCDGAMRSKMDIELKSTPLLGNPAKDYNKSQMLYGLLKDIHHLPVDEDDDDALQGDDDKPKKKKAKKETSSTKKAKVDPNSPSLNRVPLPEMRDCERIDRVRAMKELSKKINLRDNLPTIFYHSLHNLPSSITSLNVSDDSSLLAAGLLDSTIKIWSINEGTLPAMKSADELELLDKESDDIMGKIMDFANAPGSRSLFGHSGPVYSCSLSNDNTYMVSCSEDGSIRLWYLPVWSNVVCYNDCKLPVWDAKISPLGHYFASCGEEGNASLWSADQHKQLRIFTGHMSVVKCLEFHPNCNYVATGSDDRTIRVWDVLNGDCVRVFKGHKDSVSKITFSNCGRYLASTGRDKQIFVWDLSNGEHIYKFKGHSQSVKTLAFSRDDTVLASGGLDGIIKIWDINKVSGSNMESDHGDVMSSSNGQAEVGAFRTKSSPVLNLHFTRRNLLLASGPYIHPFK